MRGSEDDVFDKLRVVADAQRAPWRVEANCLGLDPALFMPEKGDQATMAEARGVCAGCRVAEDCLEQSLDAPTWLKGVFGGASEKQRRILRRRRAEVVA